MQTNNIQLMTPHQRTRRKQLYWLAAGILSLVIIGGLAAGPIMSRVEQPAYQVTASKGSIETRSYGPMIAAEVEVNGERKAAIQEGFRLIAAYIFGANKPNAKIAMTAPVTQQTDGNSWTVRFIMPSGLTMETLPAPNDLRVTLKPVPAKHMVAIRFSGTANDDLIQTKTEKLRKYASEHKLLTIGEPLLAFYNPPWTLPVFRRNEILFELGGS